MSIVRVLRKFKSLVPEPRLLELYPPFLFMGVKIKSVSADYRKMHVQLPMRWYSTNLYGTMFGGFMCAVSDPLPALLCEKIFAPIEAWTKSHAVDFMKPGKGLLDLHVVITESDVKKIRTALAAKGKVTYTFEYFFRDKRGREIAKVTNAVFLRVRT